MLEMTPGTYAARHARYTALQALYGPLSEQPRNLEALDYCILNHRNDGGFASEKFYPLSEFETFVSKLYELGASYVEVCDIMWDHDGPGEHYTATVRVHFPKDQDATDILLYVQEFRADEFTYGKSEREDSSTVLRLWWD